MEIANLPELEEKIFRKGLPKEMAADVQAAVNEGQTDITREHMTSINNDQVGFRVHFRFDTETGNAYLNRIDAAIFKSADFEGMKEHTFHDYQLITAMEAYRMLKYGELVAVNKTLRNKAGEQYNTWLSLNTTGAKDESGNYPIKSFHQNYYNNEPYVVGDVLRQLKTPVKELEQPASLENQEKLLKKAMLPSVTMMHEGREQKGLLSIDPGNGGVKLLDTNMRLVEAIARPRPMQKKGQSAEGQTAPAAESPVQDNVKKKAWNQSQGNSQRVNWNRQKSKGQSK